MKKKKILLILVIVVILLLIVVGTVLATTKTKCKSVYNGSTKVAKLCYTMNVIFRGSTQQVKCRSAGWLSTYVYSPSYQWKAKVAQCTPYSYTWRARGAGAAALVRNGLFWKNTVINCKAYGASASFSCY